MSTGSAAPKSSRLKRYFSDYEATHQSRGNKITHYFGIPMIMLSILGFFSQLRVYDIVTGGMLLWFAVSLFYMGLDFTKGFLFSIVTFLMLAASTFLPNPALLALFVVGWILQLYGHYAFEKKSPAFFQNLLHLLIGPFWIFLHIFKRKA
jgi:uncharacterized membrane protein YGL010W